MQNPALAPFDISDYRGTRGLNFYTATPSFGRIMNSYLPGSAELRADVHAHLAKYGELCGGVLGELVEACHKEGKYGELIQYDSTGNRIDAVVYSHEQREARRIAYEHGIVNLGYHSEWKHPFTFAHRMMLACMTNMNGEGGVACPLAMTDGMILVLEKIGTEEQKRKYLPVVADPKSKSHFMAGQYVTERVGGSNVGANRTVARKAPNGKWILNGEKWFCSNPGDLWVTTARVEDTSTIGLFIVSRTREDGTLNGCKLLRKKDIIGSRGKITVEAVYEDMEAEELGRTSHGLVNLIKYVINTSRLHVSAGAVGHGRRAYHEALAYSRKRTAYGKQIINLPSVIRTLARMQVLQTALEFSVFRNYDLNSKDDSLSRLLTPLLKYSSTVLATSLTHEGMLILGGNGILGDFSVLPRLHNDAIINETWEGTHFLLCEHAIKAYFRPNVQNAYKSWIQESFHSTDDGVIAEARRTLEEKLSLCETESDFWIDSHRMEFCDAIYDLFALSEMARTARETVSHSGQGAAFEGKAIAFGFAEICLERHAQQKVREGIFHSAERMAILL